MMQVNGTAVASIIPFIKSKFGDAGFQKWLETLEPEAQKIYGGMVFPSNWYSLTDVLVKPTQQICDVFYGGSRVGALECGKFSAEYGLKGVLKFFVRVASVNLLIKKASTLMSTYYKPSNIIVMENEKGAAVLHITQFPDMDEVIEKRICGWMERAIEIAGGKNVKVIVTKSMLRGAPMTEVKVYWS